ncbi:MAG: hypothetical protein AB8G26_15300 [Ilumatobacter sp.]
MQQIVLVVALLIAGAAVLGLIQRRARARASADLAQAAALAGLSFDPDGSPEPLPQFRLFLDPRHPKTTRHQIRDDAEGVAVFEFDASTSQWGSYRFSCAVATLPFTSPRMSISWRSTLGRRRAVSRLDDAYDVDVDDTAFAERMLDAPVVEWFIALVRSHGRFRPRIEVLDDRLLVMCDPLDATHSVDLLRRTIDVRNRLARTQA